MGRKKKVVISTNIDIILRNRDIPYSVRRHIRKKVEHLELIKDILPNSDEENKTELVIDGQKVLRNKDDVDSLLNDIASEIVIEKQTVRANLWITPGMEYQLQSLMLIYDQKTITDMINYILNDFVEREFDYDDDHYANILITREMIERNKKSK